MHVRGPICVLVSADPTFNLEFMNTSGTCISGMFPPFPPPPTGFTAPASPVQGSNSALVGSLVGGIVGGALLLSVAICAFWRRRRRTAQKADKGGEAPTYKSPNSLVVCLTWPLSLVACLQVQSIWTCLDVPCSFYCILGQIPRINGCFLVVGGPSVLHSADRFAFHVTSGVVFSGHIFRGISIEKTCQARDLAVCWLRGWGLVYAG